MRKLFSSILLIGFLSLLPRSALAQAWFMPAGVIELGSAGVVLDSAAGAPALASAPALPRMGPELALAAFHNRTATQVQALQSSADTTVIVAELPDTSQRGHYELRRFYAAPRSLSFSPQRFEGDGFVKSNVIIRLLQSEVEHVEKQAGPTTAISPANYKFSYKGVEVIGDGTAHVFQVKPRQKRPGLFKGKIYLNVFTGSLRRAEGALVKSPSLLIKKVEFVQDYADIDGFTLPVHLHSVSRTRIIGRAIVDIFHRDYVAKAASAVQTARGGASTIQASN